MVVISRGGGPSNATREGGGFSSDGSEDGDPSRRFSELKGSENGMNASHAHPPHLNPWGYEYNRSASSKNSTPGNVSQSLGFCS